MTEDTDSEATCLILVRDALIRQDIAQAVADAADVEVIAVDTMANATLAITNKTQLSLAFVEATPDCYRESALAAHLAERGARVVLVGSWDDRAAKAHGWAMLRFPFTTDDVLDVLRQNLH